jgi:hypothetical protein
MLKDQYLTDSNDLTIVFSHNDLATTTTGLFNRRPIRLDIIFNLALWRKRTFLDDERRIANVVESDRSNND